METNPLTLIVKEKTLGNLVTNARDIKAYVAAKLEEYSVDNYKGDSKQAAKDKAEINNAIKMLNDRRIALEKEWNLPFQEFKDIINETTGMMKVASGKLDVIVKEQESREKAEKKAEIERIWADKNFNLVSLDRIFNQKWLNKTTKLTSVSVELDDIIKTINGDLASLEAFGQDTAILKDLYLSTLNLQATLNKGAELKANRERLAQAEAEKKAQEETRKNEQKQTESEPVEDNAPTYDVDFNTHEVKKIIEVPKELAQGEKSYKFVCYGAENEVESVKAIAEEMRLVIIPSITLCGTVAEINRFKEILSDNGLGYDKANIINLAVKRA
jgi:hypothetical protein